MATKPNVSDYEQTAYKSQYQDQVDTALNKVTNRTEYSYDPLKDANYQAMAKVYKKQGEQAAKNTLADAASLNGGYGSSYAVTASQQARNDYNQQLASQIPSLEEAAYNRYLNNYNMDVQTLSSLRDADDSAYNKYRDKVSDSQWKYSTDYQTYRDDVSDSQWQKNYDRDVYESDRSYNYQKSRDAVSDSQWAQEFALQKKSAATSSGSNTGSSGYIGSNSSSGGIDYKALYDAAKESGGNGGKKKSKGVKVSNWQKTLVTKLDEAYKKSKKK